MSDALRAARGEMPLLDERIYCASQCLGPCLRATYEALDAYRASLHARSRSLDAWIERHDQLHALVERLLAAPAGSVFLAPSATSAHAALASSLAPEGSRSRIVVSSGDFHSTRFLWRAQRSRGFELHEVESNGPAHALAQTFVDAIDERVSLVALSLVSPRSGALLPARAIAERCREVGALFFVDAYQAVGALPVEVGPLGAHAVIGGTHKWLHGAGTGLAFGYVEPALAARLEPQYPGWIGHTALLDAGESFAPRAGARRFAQGTPALEPVYTAKPGIELALSLGLERVRARSLALTSHLTEGIAARGWTLRSPLEAERRGPIVCLDVDEPERVVEALAQDGIDVDARPGAGVRIGPHPCQTEAEMDEVLASLERALRS